MSRIEIISASAGTGKTTKLASLIHEAVSGGEARPEAILATTFTNRAAAELAERARETLLAVGEVESAHRLHAARIGTVNSVCGGIVQDFAFDQGFSPRVSVLDDQQAQEALLHAGSTVLPRKLLDELEELHRRLGADSPGARNYGGRNKWDWKQDVRRIVDLARSNAMGIDQFETFAERSADSLTAFLSPPARSAKILDRALEKALQRFLDNVDLDFDTTKRTREACTRAESALRRGTQNLEWSEWAALAFLQTGKKSLSHAEVVYKAADAHDRHPRLHQDLRRAIRAVFEAARYALEAYRAHKRALGVIDFVDQETEALALLKDEAVREKLREEIDLVLVDEFQDTSPIQLAIFLELSKIAPRSIWVGDPKQAIYGFRGADPALMDAAIRTLLKGKPPETLDRSYRSRPGLVRLTSEIFAPAFAEAGIAEELVRIEPGLEKEPGGLGPLFERWVLEPGISERTGKPSKNAELDLISLAAGVCALLDDSKARVRDPSTGKARASEPGDIAVLCPRNAQCTRLARELEARGVRAVVGRPGLVATLEARHAIAALRLWINPRNSLARAELARWLDSGDDVEAWLTNVLAAKERDELFSDLAPLISLREARDPRAFAGVLASFDTALAAAGVRERAVTFGDATARLANLDALRSLAARYVELCRSEGTPCSLQGLLAHLEELSNEGSDAQATAARRDAVRICTLHSSKGLEWPITVLADLTSRPDIDPLRPSIVAEGDDIDLGDPLAGRWLRYWLPPYGRRSKDVPFYNRLGDDESTDAARDAAQREDLRLIYVAWTRARDRFVYAARPDRIDQGALSVISAGEEPLVCEPSKKGRAKWGTPAAPQTITAVVRNLPPVRDGGRVPVPAEGYEPSGPKNYPPATVRPSHLGGKGTTGEVFDIGDRIHVSIQGDDEMRRFGDAAHGFLAADRQDMPAAERAELASEILERFDVLGCVECVEFPKASDQLAAWIQSTWPDATWRREWALEQRLPDGSVMRGIADLVLEAEGGLALIDHKTFPGNRDQAINRTREYAGQLTAYARALEAATGKPVLGSYVHLPVSGLIVEVCHPG